MKDFEIAMKDFNIVNLMCVGFEDYDEFINKMINQSEDYKAAEEAYNEHLDVIKEREGFDYMDKLDNKVSVMEYTSRDIAFNEGFKMGIRFMQEFTCKGEGVKA